jgi:uncharacterized protein
MSAVAVIDSLEFARAQQELRGSMPVVTLKRLEDLLFDTQGILGFELKGGRDELNRPRLEVKIEGPLHLQCQRCLDRLDYALDVSNALIVLPQGVLPPGEIEDPEGPDTIEANPELDVAALIEDEVLLSLPLAPRHPDGTCRSRLEQQGEAAERASAFAQLAALKRPPNNR